MDKEIISAIFLTRQILQDTQICDEAMNAVEKYLTDVGHTKMVYLLQEQEQIKTNQLWE